MNYLLSDHKPAIQTEQNIIFKDVILKAFFSFLENFLLFAKIQTPNKQPDTSYKQKTLL